MPRPQTFTSEQLLDAACVVAGRHGRAASVELVAVELGVSAGSVYHRTGTKRALFAQLWLRSLARFHARDISASAIGRCTAARQLHLTDDGDRALAWDFEQQALIGCAPTIAAPVAQRRAA